MPETREYLNQRRRWLLVIAVAAVIMRLAFVLIRPPVAENIFTPLNDSTDYDHLALTVLRGDGFIAPGGQPTAFRPPLYPLFLALCYTLFGVRNVMAIAIVQAFLGGLNVYLVGAIGRRANLSGRSCLLAACLYAAYPAFVFQTTQILTEVIGRTFLLLTIWALLRAFESHRSKWYVLSGALLSLAILNKSVLAATVPFLGLFVLLRGSSARATRLKFAVFFALPLVLFIGSWTVRNARVSHRFIPVSTNFPITFSFGLTKYSFYTDRWYGDSHALYQVPEDFLQKTQLRNYNGVADEMQTGQHFASGAIEFIRENPRFTLILTVRKTLHFWSPFIRNSLAARLMALFSMGFVLVLGWMAFLRWPYLAGPTRTFAILCLCIAIPVTIPYAISQPDVRYRVSLIDPLWIILAADTALAAVRKLKK